MASIKELDLGRLQPFLDRNWAVSGEGMPETAVAKLQRLVYLRVVFQIYSSSPPAISLHMPDHLAAIIGTYSSRNAFCGGIV